MARRTSSKDKSISDFNLSPTDNQIVKTVVDRYELSRTYQFTFWNDFDRYYKMYESYVNDSREQWATKIFIPMVFSVIERYLPRVLAQKPTVNFMARRPPEKDDQGNVTNDTAKAAQTNQQLFEWQWDQVGRRKDGGMYMELLRFCKDAFITGTGIAKIPWIKEVQTIKMFNDKNEPVKVDKKVFDGPDFELIDPYDFFFDPEAYDIQRASWVIHRTRRTLQEMKDINDAKGVEIYKNLDMLEAMPADNLSQTENDYKLRRKTALGSGQTLVVDRTTDKYELMECWGTFPKLDENGKKTGELEERVVVVANKNVIVRDIEYPYWHGKKPFIKYTPIPRSYDFYGVPIIKHIERPQFYMNEFVNQKFDNQTLSLNQMIVADPTANVEDWQLVWRPGGVIRANPEHIKALALGDVTSPIDASVAYLSQVTQLTTGLSDYYTSGTSPETSSNKTASGANLIEQQISDRIKQMTQVLEEEVIREIGYQWDGLNKQFIKLPMVIRVIGNDGKPEWPLITPQDVRNSFDIIPEAGSMQPVNKDLERQQLVDLIQLLQSNPIMAGLTDWQKIEEKLLKTFGFKDFNELMTNTEGQQGAPAQPGQPQDPNAPTTDTTAQQGQMLGNAATGQGGQPQGMQGPQQGQQQGSPSSQTIKPKFAELTSSEKAQALQKLGINPDMVSRLEQMSQQADEKNAGKAMMLMDKFGVQPGQTEPFPNQLPKAS